MKKVVLIMAVSLSIILAYGFANTQEQHGRVPITTLVPFKAIARDQFEYKAFPIDYGHIRPKKGYKLLAVFFSILHTDVKIQNKDTDWVIPHTGGQANALGFGLPTTPGKIRLQGRLNKEGAILIERAGENPLVALIFVVPTSLAEFEIKSPAGRIYRLSIDKQWVPMDQNITYSSKITGLSFDIKDDNLEPVDAMKPILIK